MRIGMAAEANTHSAPKCKDCDGERAHGSVRCAPCGRKRYLERRRASQFAKRQKRPGYISQADRCANGDKDRSREYTQRLAKRLGMTVDAYLEAKAALD